MSDKNRTSTPYPPAGEMPFSQEAEEAVIGSVLVNGELYIELAQILNPEDFFLTRHTLIWEGMARLQERDEPIDYLTLTEEMGAIKLKNGRTALEECGGDVYLIGLFRAVPTSVNAPIYAQLVKRAATRRRLLAVADEIRINAMREDMAIDSVIENCESALLTVTERAVSNDLLPVRDVVGKFMDVVEGRMENPLALLGIPTGFPDLDQLLDGLQAKFYVLAGRPGMGKSALLLAIALFAARMGKKVYLSTMEMEALEVAKRLVAMLSEVVSYRIQRGTMDSKEWGKFVTASGQLGELPIVIDDAKALTPKQLEMRAKRAKRMLGGLDVVFVDGLYKMRPGRKVENTRDELKKIAARLKDLTGKRELGIPILVTHQLNREVEKRADKRPVVSDLRDSGDIEGEADVVLLIYRDAFYNEATEFPNQADVIVGKHRDGSTGTVSLYFDNTITKFMNRAVKTVDLSDL